MEGRLKVYLIVFDQNQGMGGFFQSGGAVWKSGREKGKGERGRGREEGAPLI